MARENFTPQPNGQIVRDQGYASAALAGYFNNLDIVEPSRLLGRGSDNGVGVTQYLTLGSGLQLVDRELSIDFTPSAGDVAGPVSASDGFAALWDGTTGKLLKNSAVNGAWFNQAVLTGSTPTFAGAILGTLSVNGFAVTVSGAPTLNNWFDQSVKTTASPTFNVATLTGLSVNGFTVTVSGAPTLNNWFDQSVKTGASPAFAGLTVNGFAVTVSGPPTLDNWFDQSVKTTANPVFNKITSSNEIVATSFFAVGGNLGGGPHTGLQVALTAGGSVLNFDIIGGILTNTSVLP